MVQCCLVGLLICRCLVPRDRIHREKARSTEYINQAIEALRRVENQHAKHTRELKQDIEGGYDKKLAEELAQIKRDKEVLDARFAHEQDTLKKTEEEAKKAAEMTEVYRSEFELERVAQDIKNSEYVDLKQRFDRLSSQHYSKPPTPPMPRATVDPNEQARLELERELISARGEIKRS